MSDTIGSLILAVYPDRGLAEEDFEILQDQNEDEAGLEILDATMVFKDEKGRVKMSKQSRRARRRDGTKRPRRGGRAVHLQRGLQHHDVVGLADTLDHSSVALIAVAKGPDPERLVPLLHSTDLSINRLKTSDLGFRSLLARRALLG